TTAAAPAGPAFPSAASAAARPAARPATLQERILALLEDGPMYVKALRDAMPDAKPTSVSNTLTGLRDAGRVESVGRGLWQ
ncbi:hypothetical protein GT354_50540, partial [Streptomyces sp. SID3343]|nr:hypothetical protein [Streptomyces sp. SID3343]